MHRPALTKITAVHGIDQWVQEKVSDRSGRYDKVQDWDAGEVREDGGRGWRQDAGV